MIANANARRSASHSHPSSKRLTGGETGLEERGLSGEVMVSNTGCFGLCEQGPVVVVYPDNVWYGSVTPDDVEAIMEEHIEGGGIVTRLQIG